MLFMAVMALQTFPMTNRHLITGYTYTQIIHVPAIGDRPAIDIKNTFTRSFSHIWDAEGRLASVTVTGKVKPQTFQLSHSDCNK